MKYKDVINGLVQINDPEALFNLAFLHKEKLDIHSDVENVIKYLEKIANNGVLEAQFCLGFLFKIGVAGYVDKDKAIYWYRMASTSEYAPAMIALSHFYTSKDNSEEEINYGLELLKNASHLGFAQAAALLATAYSMDLPYIPYDEVKSQKFLEKAAEYGDIDSQKFLAKKLLDTESDLNIERALMWLHLAANEGNDYYAHLELYEIYSKGLHGIEVDVEHAEYHRRQLKKTDSGIG